ncbi:hypothetical protein [Sutterella sp.]|uniref:hypothetical protein n=1 Tax=Sutterella sp. TaxID=1981025 RepID=UPI0026E0650D|nr:hypothetical protein [Sutterella sp.]MDO5531948.1 hypothetical protein [Sutterella sp.]
MSISLRLSALAEKSRSWFAASRSEAEKPIATGIECVDSLLEGGFPRRGVTEILVSGAHHGEVQMLIGALSHVPTGVWVLPSKGSAPFAPALQAAGADPDRQIFVIPATPAEAFEAAEMAAASGETAAVVAWLPALNPEADRIAIRRIALAAQTTGTAVFLIRPACLACLPLAGSMRVLVTPARDASVRVRSVVRRTWSTATCEKVLPVADFFRTDRPVRRETVREYSVQPSLFTEPVPAL